MEIENGIIQHRFVHNNRDILNEYCYICGEKKENHLRELSINRNQEQNNFNINTNITDTNIDINNNDKVNTPKNNETKGDINNTEISNEISSYYMNIDENKLNELNKEDNNINL